MSDNDKLINDSVSEEILNVAEKLITENGAKNVTVRKILKEMNVTNRVFYNRFHNIDEVFHNIYKRTVLKMHESIKSDYDINTDFFNYVTDVAVKVLYMTYDLKNQFSTYMFEHDASSEANRVWWIEAIKKIIENAKINGHLKKETDSEKLSYTVWCFIRGYNADAVTRKLSKEEAAKHLTYGLNCLFDGIKA